MSELNLLLPISLLTQSMQIPLNMLLQSEFVNLVTLVYSNKTIEAATAASNAINNAQQYWQTINVDRSFNLFRYYTKVENDRVFSAQDRDLIILALNVNLLTTQQNYCLGFLLCSFLVIIENENIIDDLKNYIKDLIVKIRSANVIHFLAILVYSKMGDKGQFYFLSDNNEIIQLDPLQ